MCWRNVKENVKIGESLNQRAIIFRYPKFSKISPKSKNYTREKRPKYLPKALKILPKTVQNRPKVERRNKFSNDVRLFGLRGESETLKETKIPEKVRRLFPGKLFSF